MAVGGCGLKPTGSNFGVGAWDVYWGYDLGFGPWPNLDLKGWHCHGEREARQEMPSSGVPENARCSYKHFVLHMSGSPRERPEY